MLAMMLISSNQWLYAEEGVLEINSNLSDKRVSKIILVYIKTTV